MEVVHGLVGTATGLRIEAVFGAAGRSPREMVGKLPRRDGSSERLEQVNGTLLIMRFRLLSIILSWSYVILQQKFTNATTRPWLNVL